MNNVNQQCKARLVPRNIYPRRESQCVRDAVEDGFCWQHLRQNRAPKKQSKDERIRELEAEVARLRGVIWRNADPYAASKEDTAIIEEIARSITP